MTTVVIDLDTGEVYTAPRHQIVIGVPGKAATQYAGPSAQDLVRYTKNVIDVLEARRAHQKQIDDLSVLLMSTSDMDWAARAEKILDFVDRPKPAFTAVGSTVHVPQGATFSSPGNSRVANPEFKDRGQNMVVRRGPDEWGNLMVTYPGARPYSSQYMVHVDQVMPR